VTVPSVPPEVIWSEVVEVWDSPGVKREVTMGLLPCPNAGRPRFCGRPSSFNVTENCICVELVMDSGKLSLLIDMFRVAKPL